MTDKTKKASVFVVVFSIYAAKRNKISVFLPSLFVSNQTLDQKRRIEKSYGFDTTFRSFGKRLVNCYCIALSLVLRQGLLVPFLP